MAGRCEAVLAVGGEMVVPGKLRTTAQAPAAVQEAALVRG